MSIWRQFLQSGAKAAVLGQKIDFEPPPEPDLVGLVMLALEHKLETALAPVVPDLAPVITLHDHIYRDQTNWLKSNYSRFSHLDTLRFIQGFPRNRRFGPALPASQRSDIDYVISDKENIELLRIFSGLGLRQTFFVDGELVTLDDDEIADIESSSGYAYPKNIPYSVDLPFQLPHMGSLEIGDALGPLRKMGEDFSLLVIFERTLSFGGPHDLEILLDKTNRILLDGLPTSNDEVYILFATVRFYKATWNGEQRMRSLLEMAHVLGPGQSGFRTDLLLRLAEKSGLEREVYAVLDGFAEISPEFAEACRQRQLPLVPDMAWKQKMYEAQSGVGELLKLTG